MPLTRLPGLEHTSHFAIRSAEVREREERDSIESQQVVLRDVLRSIKEHPSAWPFLKPVDRNEVADYYDIIRDPIGIPPLPRDDASCSLVGNAKRIADLETMEKRLDSGQYYITREIFLADLRRMCANCRYVMRTRPVRRNRLMG